MWETTLNVIRAMLRIKYPIHIDFGRTDIFTCHFRFRKWNRWWCLNNAFKYGKPLRPESFIARTKEEVISAAGSKYCPVRQIWPWSDKRNEGRFIVIGLPCHIQGLRNVQILNRELEKKVTLVLGLSAIMPNFPRNWFFCSRNTKSPVKRYVDWTTEAVVGQLYENYDEWLHSTFHPFQLIVLLGLHLPKFFWPRRCLVCNDKLCQFADIIFMDAWLPEFSSDKTGVSLVVVRSKKGEEFVSKAAERGIIKLQPIPAEAILRSQQISKITRRVAVTDSSQNIP